VHLATDYWWLQRRQGDSPPLRKTTSCDNTGIVKALRALLESGERKAMSRFGPMIDLQSVRPMTHLPRESAALSSYALEGAIFRRCEWPLSVGSPPA